METEKRNKHDRKIKKRNKNKVQKRKNFFLKKYKKTTINKE